jgi:hypothetical protein
MKECSMLIIPSLCRIKQFAAAALLASLGGATAWAGAQIEQAPAQDLLTLVVPGYGPGIAGRVVEAPITPVCRPNTACTGPFADATVLILDPKTRFTVGTAVTNASGHFIVTLPPLGSYVVHVKTVDFPRCPEVQAEVEQLDFTLVQISCDTRRR